MEMTVTHEPYNPKIALRLLPEEVPVTGDLVLRRASLSDARHIFEIIERNPEVRDYVAWAAKVYAPEDVVPRLQWHSTEDMDGRFLVVADGEVVGYAGIHPGHSQDEYSLGYFLDKDARGHGYVTLSVGALVEQVRERLGSERIYIQIIPSNGDSVAVAVRLGFIPGEMVMGVDFPVEQQRFWLAPDKSVA